MQLHGGASVSQARDPYLEVWRGSQLYQQGAFAMSYNDFRFAAECFRQSGDAFLGALGEGRFAAESRFAEGQCRRFMGDNQRAGKLFQIAADMFRRADPYNPYLRAALQNMMLMGYVDKPAPPPLVAQKPKPAKVVAAIAALKELRPNMACVERVLKGNATKLSDGTLIASLHENDFFSGSRKLVPRAAGCDVSDKFIKAAVHRTFLKMTCLEFAALGANYLTVNEVYKPFLSDDKPVVIGVSDDVETPSAKIAINGKEYNVPMDLPNVAKYSKNVLLLTNGQQVIAVDPRKDDVWKLMPAFNDKGKAEFNWWKLTHTKKGVASKPVASKP